MIKSVLKYAALLSLVALTACGNRALDFDDDFAAAGASFSPLDIANCELWLDASDASTVLASATAVTNWLDKSTIGDNAVQIGIASTRPTYPADTLNGRNTMSFDGGDYLGCDYKSVDGQTLFVVAKSTMKGRYVIGSRDSTNQRSTLWDFGGDVFIAVGSNAGRQTGVSFSTYRYIAWHYNGSTVVANVDGTEVINIAQTGSGANTTQGYMIGTFNDAGAPYIGPFTGNIAEIIIYKRVLSSDEIATVEVYLKAKWGL